MRFLSSLLFVCVLGCNQASTATPVSTSAPGDLPREGATLATVFGQPVTQSMLDAYLTTLPEQVRAEIEAKGGLDQLVEQLVTQDALYQEAIARKLHQEEIVQTRLRLSERDALIESLLRQVVDERVSDDVAREWYQAHLVQFRQPQVKASHILVPEEEAAKQIFEEVQKPGADFVAVARERSKDPSAKENGGDLGWFGKRDMVPAFADAAFEAEKDTIVGPVKSNFGWHVIHVQDKREMIPFEEVEETILPRVSQEVASKYVEELKAQAATASAPPAGAATAAAPAAAPAATPSAAGPSGKKPTTSPAVPAPAGG